MVAGKVVCLRRLAKGVRAREVQFNRFLGNARVTTAKVIESWSGRIKQRTALSPLIFAGYSDIGPLNQWVHVWAYKNMGERETKRAQAMKPGQWPPPRHESVVLHKQTSTFAIPAKWSPLR